MTTDEAVGQAQTRMASAYGAGVIPWQQIIAMILSMLAGCTPTPTHIKAQMKRPVIQAMLLRRLHQQGYYGATAQRILNATTTALDAATDEELIALIEASQESA